jgi:hypothetical protein
MPTPVKRDELRLLGHSKHPLIAVEISEERRVEELLAQVAAELDIPFWTWTVTAGLTHRGTGTPTYDTEEPEKALAAIAQLRGDGIFLLKDFVRYLEQPKILRRARELATSFREVRRSLVLSAPVIRLPAELEDEAVPFHLELPGPEQLFRVVQQVLNECAAESGIRQEIDAAGMRQLAQNLNGLTLDEARRTLARVVLKRHRAAPANGAGLHQRLCFASIRDILGIYIEARRNENSSSKMGQQLGGADPQRGGRACPAAAGGSTGIHGATPGNSETQAERPAAEPDATCAPDHEAEPARRGFLGTEERS